MTPDFGEQSDAIRLGYALGWSFTPLKGKVPQLSAWQARPRPTLEESIAWATGGNVGLRTGSASGIAVIDIEAEGVNRRWEFPETVTVFTGGGGYHLYYLCDPQRPVRNSCRKALGEYVDVKGENGQVVYVGSRHPTTGKAYRWMFGQSPVDMDLAPFPYHLLPREPTSLPQRHTPPPTYDLQSAAQRCWKYVAKMDRAVSGQGGDAQTFTVACRIWQFGVDESAARNILQWYNDNRCDPRWSAGELEHKLTSAREVTARSGETGAMMQHTNFPSTNLIYEEVIF